jgi:octaprenyl-diphosphate synthase
MLERSSPSLSLRAALERIGGGLELVERALREQLASPQELIGTIGEHVLSSGGKRMRPALLFLAAELCGYTGPRRVQVAAAVELLHTASLLHDDVVDLGQVRRGRPSANAIWGNSRAVLVGDFCLARASSMIVEDGDLDILWIFANTIRLMSEGELLQMQRSFDASVTEAHYYAVIDRKSATLLSAASEAGAILGGVTRPERRRLAEFGREMGLAFQLRDDALDYSADEEVLGKQPFSDLREGKVTLPLLLALKRCRSSERDAVEAILKTASMRLIELRSEDPTTPRAVIEGNDLELVVELVQRHRGVADSNRRAEQHVARAAATIAPFADCPAKEALLAAAEYAAARAY